MFLNLFVDALHRITRQAIYTSSRLDNETCNAFTKSFDETGGSFLFSSLERLRDKTSDAIEESQAEFL
jgi:hypothetical protein